MSKEQRNIKNMRTLKSLLASTFLMLIMLVQVETIYAQNAKQEVKSKERIEKLKSALGVNDEIAQKIVAIEKDAHDKVMELRKNNTGDKQAIRPQMQAIRKERDDKVAGILTKEQMQKFQDLEKQKMMEHKEKGSNE